MCLKYLQDNFNIILALVILIILTHVYLIQDKEKFQSGNKFVMYHTLWCGYSKRAKKEFDKLGTSYNNITIKDVNCDQNKTKCSSENIRGYPTIKLHKSNGDVLDYNGDRTKSGFEQFLNRH